MSKSYQGTLFSSQDEQSNQDFIFLNYIVVKKRDRHWIEAYIPPQRIDWVLTIKNITGQHWHKEKNCWILPYVKQTFYHLRDHVKLCNIKFGFKIEANIPKEYVEVTTIERLNDVHPITKFDQLSPAQKNAILKIEEYLALRRYSYNTIKTYTHSLTNLFRFHKNISPENYYSDHVQVYLLELIKTKKVSISTQNQIINAYKIFAEKILKRPKEFIEIPRPKRPRKLPGILSTTEVVRIFKATANLKHKLILLLIYSSGLRKFEALNILVNDVQIERRCIHIQKGKGNKDRYVVLAESVVPYLEKYLEEYRPKRWLFEGIHGGKYSQRSVHNIFDKALERSKVNAYATLHTLRHSYATHCLENGHNLKSIQYALGHKSLKTTEVYLHLTSDAMKKMKSPLDEIKR